LVSFRSHKVKLDSSSGALRRAIQYASYDWTREMPKPKRLVTWISILLQGYALYSWSMWSLFKSSMLSGRWLGYLLLLPNRPPAYLFVLGLYMTGFWIMNGMLTSELVRKTQLESERIAAQQIQKTLHPQKVEDLPGYKVEVSYVPYREVGGDYFDVIELPGNRTLFALADVSGKGMPAALLAANIQALVRSIANVDPDPVRMAHQINQHLIRYTPAELFATAVFVVLSRDSGELSFVNAGHNSPVLSCSGSATVLHSTSMPLGLFKDAAYEAGESSIFPGCALLLFTDGLTDSIPGTDPEGRLRSALATDSERTLAEIQSLVDPKLIADDITILLIKRTAEPASSGAPRLESCS